MCSCVHEDECECAYDAFKITIFKVYDDPRVKNQADLCRATMAGSGKLTTDSPQAVIDFSIPMH